MIGIVSDIHGNKQAFEAVLDSMPTVDTLVCCGDIVGYGANPKWCVETVRARADIVVCGNHDTAVVNEPNRYHNEMAVAGIQHARSELQNNHYQWLSSLPKTRSDGTNFVFHAHPNNIEKRIVPEDVREGFSDYIGEYTRLVYGHTHLPTAQEVEGTEVINPGSVGQPRDKDSRASYALLSEGKTSIQRVEYDINAAQEAIRRAGLPEETANRLERGV